MMLADVILCAVFIIITHGPDSHERMITTPTEDITACVKEGIRLSDEMKAAYPNDKSFEIAFRIITKKDKQA